MGTLAPLSKKNAKKGNGVLKDTSGKPRKYTVSGRRVNSPADSMWTGVLRLGAHPLPVSKPCPVKRQMIKVLQDDDFHTNRHVETVPFDLADRPLRTDDAFGFVAGISVPGVSVDSNAKPSPDRPLGFDFVITADNKPLSPFVLTQLARVQSVTWMAEVR